ncbi:MAG: TIGR02117 family protein [Hyphomicrobiales bacterium]|nr:TIGR02117 family protein [Hyphomicrobiales bacterium]
MNIARGGKWVAITAIAVPFFITTVYLLSALVGGLIASPENISRTAIVEEKDKVDLYLLSTLLHVDIAIPVTDEVKRQFAFLEEDGFSLSHPQLKYLIIGWGSREFYTSTKTLMDIGPGPVFSAVTGDESVIHIIFSANVPQIDEIKKVTVARSGLRAMIKNIKAGFTRSTLGNPILLRGVSHGLGDVFYEAKEHFNIFQPCNIWTAKMLRSAGVKTGIWTPTTYSLMLSLD